jgi:hypothetical protein
MIRAGGGHIEPAAISREARASQRYHVAERAQRFNEIKHDCGSGRRDDTTNPGLN